MTQAQDAAPAATTAAGVDQPAEDFQRGLDALQNGQFHNAIAAFKASYDGDHNPAALFNLGIAYTNADRVHEAVLAFDEYIAQADAARDAESVAAVRAESERLRSESAIVTLKLTPASASLELDGEPTTLRQGELLAVPGKHRVSAYADGYRRFDQTGELQIGPQPLEITLEAIDTSASAAAKTAPAAGGAAPVTPTPAAPAQAPDDSGANDCLLPEVCIGPVLAVGPPNVFGGGVHARWRKYLGIGVDFQMLPTLTFRPYSFGSWLFSANLRVYPLGNAFFVSGGFAYQSFYGNSSEDSKGPARVYFPAATLGIGVLGHKGFVAGIDAGFLFPLSSLRNDNEVAKVVRVLPFSLQLNLIRLGYMF